MKIEFWYIGKTNESYLEKGMAIYEKRLIHYCKYSSTCFKDVKVTSSHDALKKKEAEMILNKLNNDDYLILLDEKGKSYTSVKFASWIEQLQMQGRKRIIFLVAGAFGADDSLKKRANAMLSFSAMTFSHQMIRLFFTEQLYRAFSIIKNEKYHNE